MTNQNPQTHEIEAREKAALVTEDTRPGWVFRPDVDILESEDAYIIVADVPGASEESIDIQLEKGVLTLDARTAADESQPQPIYAEYRSGGYHREFRISEDIDPDGVSAKMKDGVLELRLPKSASSRPRRITVQAA
jgi:HSP20 family molecular chaperone IbpA